MQARPRSRRSRSRTRRRSSRKRTKSEKTARYRSVNAFGFLSERETECLIAHFVQKLMYWEHLAEQLKLSSEELTTLREFFTSDDDLIRRNMESISKLFVEFERTLRNDPTLEHELQTKLNNELDGPGAENMQLHELQKIELRTKAFASTFSYGWSMRNDWEKWYTTFGSKSIEPEMDTTFFKLLKEINGSIFDWHVVHPFEVATKLAQGEFPEAVKGDIHHRVWMMVSRDFPKKDQDYVERVLRRKGYNLNEVYDILEADNNIGDINGCQNCLQGFYDEKNVCNNCGHWKDYARCMLHNKPKVGQRKDC